MFITIVLFYYKRSSCHLNKLKNNIFFRILYKRLFNGDARLCWKTLFQKRTITTTGNTTDYLEPISNTNANYQELSPNNIYHELNSNTNYQELKIQYVEINQYQSTTLWSYAIYFCMYLFIIISFSWNWNVTFSWVKYRTWLPDIFLYLFGVYQ